MLEFALTISTVSEPGFRIVCAWRGVSSGYSPMSESAECRVIDRPGLAGPSLKGAVIHSCTETRPNGRGCPLRCCHSDRVTQAQISSMPPEVGLCGLTSTQPRQVGLLRLFGAGMLDAEGDSRHCWRQGLHCPISDQEGSKQPTYCERPFNQAIHRSSPLF